MRKETKMSNRTQDVINNKMPLEWQSLFEKHTKELANNIGGLVEFSRQFEDMELKWQNITLGSELEDWEALLESQKAAADGLKRMNTGLQGLGGSWSDILEKCVDLLKGDSGYADSSVTTTAPEIPKGTPKKDPKETKLQHATPRWSKPEDALEKGSIVLFKKCTATLRAFVNTIVTLDIYSPDTSTFVMEDKTNFIGLGIDIPGSFNSRWLVRLRNVTGKFGHPSVCLRLAPKLADECRRRDGLYTPDGRLLMPVSPRLKNRSKEGAMVIFDLTKDISPEDAKWIFEPIYQRMYWDVIK